MEWYKKIKHHREESSSVLLLYDFLAPERVEPEFVEIITRMASIQEWDSVIFIAGKEMERIMDRRYSCSIERLRDAIGHREFDEIYLARDYCGYGSPLIINAYKGAKRIMYGDSLGVVGNESSISGFNWQAPMRSALSLCRAKLRRSLYGGPDKLRFDAAVLTLPIVCSSGYLEGVSLLIPEIEFVVSTVKAIYNKVNDLRGYCDSLVGNSGEPGVLFLLSNLNGSGFMSKESEMELYLEIIRNKANKDSRIFLKPHPRNTGDIVEALVDRLRSSYEVTAIDDARFSRIPIELWVGLIEACAIIPMFSTSAINLKYIYGKSVSLPLNVDLVRKYFFRNKVSYILGGNHLISQSIENLAKWDGQSVLFECNL